MIFENSLQQTQAHGSATQAVNSGLFPCTLAQQRLWQHEQLRSGNPAHNLTMRWDLRGAADETAVRRAFSALTQRHEILRTCYIEREGTLRQIVLTSVAAQISTVDLSRKNPDARVHDCEQTCSSNGARAFDLSYSPPVRLMLVRLEPQHHVLQLTLHRIAADSATLALLGRDLGALMGGRVLPPLELQFADYALWQSDMVTRGAFDGDGDYWHGALAGTPPAKAEASAHRHAGVLASRALPAILTANVEARARQHGQTLFAHAVTALVLALAAETGTNDVLAALLLDGRNDPLLRRVAGPLANTVLLRCKLDDATTLADAHATCQMALDGALRHGAYPFEMLPQEGVAVSLEHRVTEIAARPVGGVELVPVLPEAIAAQADLSFVFENAGTTATLICRSLRDGDGRLEIDRLLARWETALQRLSGDLTNPVTLRPAPVQQLHRARPRLALPTPEPSAATSPLETHVLAIWRDVLGQSALDRRSDFFVSGGDAERSALVLSRVRTLTGTAVPDGLLAQNPVLSDFVAAVAGQLPGFVSTPVARIQPHGALPPVIALNDGAIYHPIAHQIGRDRPFINVHLSGPGGTLARPRETFEDFAADAVRLIKQAQPQGPYTLIGHCLIGTVAFAAAQRLRRQGDTVSLLVMLDTQAPDYAVRMPWHDRVLRRVQLLGDSWRYFGEWLAKLRCGELTLQDLLFQYGFIRRSGVLPLLGKLGLPRPAGYTPESYAALVFSNHLSDTGRAYRIEPYDGDVLQFRAETARTGRLFDRGFGWGRWMRGRYDVVDVPGDHFSMMRASAAAVIGPTITRRLAEIETKAAAQRL